jgi:hypothetical protein
MVLAIDPLSDEAVMEFDAADTVAARTLRSAGRRPNFASVACRRVPGPLLAAVPLSRRSDGSEDVAWIFRFGNWNFFSSDLLDRALLNVV